MISGDGYIIISIGVVLYDGCGCSGDIVGYGNVFV